jgi:PAS domain S-box-containing protein
MAGNSQPPRHRPIWSDEPTLEDHLKRIADYLQFMGLAAFPASETPLRGNLADFMEEHLEEAVRTWLETVRKVLGIDESRLEELASDIREATRRWIAHIRNPEDVETYAVLRRHARRGFISQHPPSRFLASQQKIRQIYSDLLHREMRDAPALPELLALLDQEFWERTLHITDYFVEGREQDLADQAESYRRSINSAPAPMFTVDADSGRILDCNQVAAREVRRDGEPISGRHLWELHPESEHAAVRALFEETVASGWSKRENLHLVRPERDPLPVDVRTALIEYRDNRKIQVIYVDLSERRLLEFKLIQSEKMAAIGQLAAGIAHEIRNPLGIIMNALYDLAELLPDPEPEVREDLQIARVEMARVQEIISNLLEFSRDNKTEVQSVDLNGLIARTLKLMNKYLQNNGVRAATTLGDVPPCDANENGMRQVLLNLITNAVQAMPEGGELRIETTPAGRDRVRLIVADNGVGIPAERLSKVFDPFFTTKQPGEGTGLGLSVVHSVVKNARGRIDVSSTPGRGTTFVIELPVHGAALERDLAHATAGAVEA